jgi:CheY-like chemotaxis protein
LGNDVHLVAVTGYGQTEDKARALAHGFDSHLVKPVNFQSLYKLIGCQNGS